MEINVRIKNIRQIRRAFGKAPVLMKSNLVKALNKSVLSIGREASKLVSGGGPLHAIDTGRMRASIMGGSFSAKGNVPGGSFRARVGVQPAQTTSLVASVGPTVDYAVYVHEGTSKMRARPFLKTAVENEQDTVDREFTDAVQKTLDQIGRQV